MHGDVLETEQRPAESFGHRCVHRRQGRTCKHGSKSDASRVSESHFKVATENTARECRSHTLKFGGRRDDVIPVPKVVRCSNAWVDFSATELPVRKPDRDQKPECWHRPRNAWMPRSKTSVAGFAFADHAAIQEFDVYRLRSFATAAGRIVKRGDYFRVRQRVHPTEAHMLEPFRGPIQTVSVNPVKTAASPSTSPRSPTSRLSSTTEYRPVVYYATNHRDAPDGEETAGDDVEEDFSDEKTKLLADRGRPSGYFSRITQRCRSSEWRGSHRRGRDAAGSPSTELPGNNLEQSRVRSLIRVVVLGDRAVGKTTLARQLLTSEHLANRSAGFSFTQGRLNHHR